MYKSFPPEINVAIKKVKVVYLLKPYFWTTFVKLWNFFSFFGQWYIHSLKSRLIRLTGLRSAINSGFSLMNTNYNLLCLSIKPFPSSIIFYHIFPFDFNIKVYYLNYKSFNNFVKDICNLGFIWYKICQIVISFLLSMSSVI